MLKIFQITSEVNTGSVGRIAEQIGESIINQGWESYIAYGREGLESSSVKIKIGNKFDFIRHGILTRITDRHGFGSKKATIKLIEKIKDINPDIIQLQHLHGYYINIKLLFNFLKEYNRPVVWTFHDCWSFTGHCAHFEFIKCDKWINTCNNCPQKNEYPKSFFIDNSYKNFIDKKKLFNSVENLTIVPVSNWLGDQTEKSFLNKNKIKVIQNGIDLEKFNIQNHCTEIKIKYNVRNKFLILGVASPWNNKKGLNFFIELSKKLNDNYLILLVGLNKHQFENLPSNMIGIQRTENVTQLAELYSTADVFINPTLEDTFPTTNLESLACGTPVITFNTGGSPEAIDDNTGIIVEKGDVDGLENAIKIIKSKGKNFYQKDCRERAEKLFDKKNNFEKYIDLYKEILSKETKL
ncbi:glycosyltransferase [Empedobacter sp.]|uniref:glycosyltransferase n=1 Tax=Empedobacter sp. TaxID=1927715 RepID=UPI0028AAD858|nr:glycosyltransferase [Empedobacter sp.]